MKPKVLTMDIETSPLIAYAWGPKWETNLIEIIEQSKILSFSAKWLEGSHITKGLPDYKGYKPNTIDDKKIVEEIKNLFDAADLIVVQNGKAFDTKTINSRFLYHNFTPPSPYKIVDTLTEARRYLKLPSYSLNDMCNYFGIGGKVEHEGFPLWKKCIAGDLKAWKRMLKYNKHDVTLTEELYLKLFPFIKSPLNQAIFAGKAVCPNCGSSNLQARGYSISKVGKYHKFQCQDCASWGRQRTNLIKHEINVSI